MRIFNKDWRITLGGKTDEEIFTPEVHYYRTHNQYPVVLFGKPITNVYKRINVQILLTRACNFKCPFCIENDGMTLGKPTEGKYWLPLLVRQVLTQYKEQNITPTISITGGEPTLFPDKLYHLLDIVGSFVGGTDGIKFININTNGTNLNVPKDFDWLRINLSRHHYGVDQNKSIFGPNYKTLTNDLIEGTNLQCVLMRGYIDSIKEMKEYMAAYSMGAGYSFRGLTTLDNQKGYSSEALFTQERFIDIKPLLDEIAKDPEFEFIQQKIGDHYIYEIYKYKGKVFRVVYSNFAWLRKVEAEERNRNVWNSRATIIHPNAVYSGWTYDLNRVHTRA